MYLQLYLNDFVYKLNRRMFNKESSDSLLQSITTGLTILKRTYSFYSDEINNE
jgi:hypothetical protein